MLGGGLYYWPAELKFLFVFICRIYGIYKAQKVFAFIIH
jgi:hypothetical protein